MNKADSPLEPITSLEPVEQNLWPGLLITGIIVILLGAGSVLLPFIATFAIEILIATLLIIAGVIHIFHAFHTRRFKGGVWRFLTGILYMIAGVLLLFFPLQGVITLTILLALLFIASGIFKIALAFNLKPLKSWGWVLFSGILSLLLGLVIWSGMPGTAGWVIGLLVGIELFITGWMMIMYAVSLKTI